MIAKISEVKKGSVAATVGVQVGDVLENIDGIFLRDVIDFQVHSYSPELNLNILRSGQKLCFKIKKIAGESLGIKFSSSVFEKLKFCKNRCIFCFIDQLPAGVRKTLFIKDDDYRLSFLYGNFITLTNLNDIDLKRIKEQRLSPLYVSLHSTDPEVRSKLIRPRGEDRAFEYLEYLLKAGIHIHIQIVLCPDVNDGDNLRRTLSELFEDYIEVESVGIVPVGLTAHRKGLCSMRSFTAEEAGLLIEEIGILQKKFLERKKSSWVFLADEFYLMSNKTLPNKEYYEDFPQIENGIGLTRLFLSDFKEALMECANVLKPLKGTILTGEMPGLILKDASEKLKKFGVFLDVKKVQNKFFGENVTVAGLVTGSDILNALKDRTFEPPVFLPDIMLNDDGLFLDNMTIDDLKQKLKIPIYSVSSSGEGFVRDLIKISAGS